MSTLLDSLDPADMRIISGNTFTDDDGKRFIAVYSFGFDAVTWVDEAEERRLLAAGVIVVDSLPDDTEVERSTASDQTLP